MAVEGDNLNDDAGKASGKDLKKKLMRASLDGDASKVRSLIESGCPVNIERKGWTPLIHAARRGHAEVVEILVQSKADLESREPEHGWTALMSAVRFGNEDVVSKLLKAGASHKATSNGGFSALIIGAYYGKDKAVKHLITAKADLNLQCEGQQWTALTCASRFGHSGIVKMLVEAGADTSLTDADKFSPLSVATFFGNTSVVKVLLTARADVEQKNKDGDTPLFIASRKGNFEILSIFVQNGANIHTKNDYGQNLRWICQDWKRLKRILEKRGSQKKRQRGVIGVKRSEEGVKRKTPAEEPSSGRKRVRSKVTADSSKVAGSARKPQKKKPQVSTESKVIKTEDAGESWVCAQCTLKNDAESVKCILCGYKKKRKAILAKGGGTPKNDVVKLQQMQVEAMIRGSRGRGAKKDTPANIPRKEDAKMSPVDQDSLKNRHLNRAARGRRKPPGRLAHARIKEEETEKENSQASERIVTDSDDLTPTEEVKNTKVSDSHKIEVATSEHKNELEHRSGVEKNESLKIQQETVVLKEPNEEGNLLEKPSLSGEKEHKDKEESNAKDREESNAATEPEVWDDGNKDQASTIGSDAAKVVNEPRKEKPKSKTNLGSEKSSPTMETKSIEQSKSFNIKGEDKGISKIVNPEKKYTSVATEHPSGEEAEDVKQHPEKEILKASLDSNLKKQPAETNLSLGQTINPPKGADQSARAGKSKVDAAKSSARVKIVDGDSVKQEAETVNTSANVTGACVTDLKDIANDGSDEPEKKASTKEFKSSSDSVEAPQKSGPKAGASSRKPPDSSSKVNTSGGDIAHSLKSEESLKLDKMKEESQRGLALTGQPLKDEVVLSKGGQQKPKKSLVESTCVTENSTTEIASENPGNLSDSAKIPDRKEVKSTRKVLADSERTTKENSMKEDMTKKDVPNMNKNKVTNKEKMTTKENLTTKEENLDAKKESLATKQESLNTKVGDLATKAENSTTIEEVATEKKDINEEPMTAKKLTKKLALKQSRAIVEEALPEEEIRTEETASKSKDVSRMKNKSGDKNRSLGTQTKTSGTPSGKAKVKAVGKPKSVKVCEQLKPKFGEKSKSVSPQTNIKKSSGIIVEKNNKNFASKTKKTASSKSRFSEKTRPSEKSKIAEKSRASVKGEKLSERPIGKTPNTKLENTFGSKQEKLGPVSEQKKIKTQIKKVKTSESGHHPSAVSEKEISSKPRIPEIHGNRDSAKNQSKGAVGKHVGKQRPSKETSPIKKLGKADVPRKGGDLHRKPLDSARKSNNIKGGNVSAKHDVPRKPNDIRVKKRRRDEGKADHGRKKKERLASPKSSPKGSPKFAFAKRHDKRSSDGGVRSLKSKTVSTPSAPHDKLRPQKKRAADRPMKKKSPMGLDQSSRRPLSVEKSAENSHKKMISKPKKTPKQARKPDAKVLPIKKPVAKTSNQKPVPKIPNRNKNVPNARPKLAAKKGSQPSGRKIKPLPESDSDDSSDDDDSSDADIALSAFANDLANKREKEASRSKKMSPLKRKKPTDNKEKKKKKKKKKEQNVAQKFDDDEEEAEIEDQDDTDGGNDRGDSPDESEEKWQCRQCTLENAAEMVNCLACGSKKPRKAAMNKFAGPKNRKVWKNW